MIRLSHLSFAGVFLTGTAIAAVTSFSNPPQSIAQQPAQNNTSANFSDTRNTWARPFITALAQHGIINGYPDGTYRPNRPVERDEFAAIIREAFNQNAERQISRGSVYRDIPKGYWAESAIKDAYEMGFMRGYPNYTFRPNQPVTRVEALTSLATNLELTQRVPSVPQGVRADTQPTQAPTQATSPQRPRRQIFFPIAALSLMQPLINATANAAPQPTQVKQQAAKMATSTGNATQVPASTTLNSYYQDANQIPQYAKDAIASVTRAGIVVNHPKQRLLRPNQPATRADIAAFIYQALVNKGELQPLANNVSASQYIVGRNAMKSNNQAQR